jgi:hypothetical protein
VFGHLFEVEEKRTMLKNLRAFLLGALLALSVLIQPQAATACSICLAGDPIFSNQGTTAQKQGDFSLFFQAMGWRKKSGLLPGEDPDGVEINDSQRLDLFFSWTPIDRVTLTLDLPFAFNEITEIEDGEEETSSLSGFSDMSLQSTVVLWRNRDILPSTWFEGRAFLKFPTGKSKQTVDGRQDPHLQLGTGSWDFGFGLAAVHRLEWGSLYSSTFYRVNTKGSLQYEYGDVFLFNAAVLVPLGHALKQTYLNPFTLGFEANFRWADFDEVGGVRFQDSGGSILYLTPSLSARLPWPWEGDGPSVRGSVQIPVTSSWLNGFQEEDPIWFAGIQYSF